MPQRSHVPKFGNWDSENVPYTTYFENARTEKDKGTKIMNPNDPEENPSLFSHGMIGIDNNGSDEHAIEVPQSHSRKKEERRDKEERENGHKIRTSTSTNTESGSDISSSDRSLIHSKSHRKGGNNSLPPPSPSPSSWFKGGNRGTNDVQHHKVASIPKFGSWDETDPASGQGFTIIFNKVKEEKHIGANNFPIARPELSIYANGQRDGSTKTKTKTCCCFFRRSSK